MITTKELYGLNLSDAAWREKLAETLKGMG